VHVTAQTVSLSVPPTPGYLALLRTVVGGCAGREGFTLDQIDDVKMAVDEAAVQLLRASSGQGITVDVELTERSMEVRVSAEVSADGPVIDESSFSWTILQALADDLRVDRDEARCTVVLTKHRFDAAEDASP
jgi:serine/threonine-protein kinase RsbW